ncbi:MAG: transposase family protein [Gemmatimonadaceae bacterium]|nr:transposase family protein [Gemmatimonadaceae bacterium]
MNCKRIERLYRLEGLAVPRRKRKRLAVPRAPRPEAKVPNDTWGIDFVRDQLASGCRIRCGTPVDGCTRATLKITVNHSLPSVAVIAALDAVIAALDAVIATRGQPVRLSRDNGSECGSRAFDAWVADRDIAPAFIQPGKPIHNAHLESFNGRFRDECHNQHYFLSLADARFHIERRRRAYNEERPHEAWYPLTPSEYAPTFQSSPLIRQSAYRWRKDGGTHNVNGESSGSASESGASIAKRRGEYVQPARSRSGPVVALHSRGCDSLRPLRRC